MSLFENSTDSAPVEDFENLEGQAQDGGAEVPEEPTEEPEAPETEEEPEEQPDEEPGQLFAGKFKTPQDMETAYVNLQKKMGEMGNHIAQLRRQSPQPQGQGPSPQQVEEYNTRFWDDFQRSPLETLANVMQTMIQQQVSPMIQPLQSVAAEKHIDRAVTGMSDITDADGVQIYPDAAELAPLIKQTLLENEHLWSAPNALDIVYSIAKGKGAMEAVNHARQAGLDEGYKNAAVKKMGSVTGTKAKSKTTPKLSPEDAVLADIMSVRRGGLFE